MRLDGHVVLIIPDDLRGRALSETILFLDSYEGRPDFQNAVGKALRRRYRKVLLTFDAWDRITAEPFDPDDGRQDMCAEKAVVEIAMAYPVNGNSWVLTIRNDVYWETGTSEFRHFVPRSLRAGDETISNSIGLRRVNDTEVIT